MGTANHAAGAPQGGHGDLSKAIRLLKAEASWRREEAAKGCFVAPAFDKQADALSYAATVLERLGA